MTAKTLTIKERFDRDLAKVQASLKALPNVYRFAVDHDIPLRTIMRVKAGGKPTMETLEKLRAALGDKASA